MKTLRFALLLVPFLLPRLADGILVGSQYGCADPPYVECRYALDTVRVLRSELLLAPRIRTCVEDENRQHVGSFQLTQYGAVRFWIQDADTQFGPATAGYLVAIGNDPNNLSSGWHYGWIDQIGGDLYPTLADAQSGRNVLAWSLPVSRKWHRVYAQYSWLNNYNGRYYYFTSGWIPVTSATGAFGLPLSGLELNLNKYREIRYVPPLLGATGYYYDHVYTAQYCDTRG